MTFAIVKRDKKKANLRILIYSSVLVIILEALIYPEDNNLYSYFLGIQFLIWLLTITYIEYFVKPFKILGYFSYENNNFIIKDKFSNKNKCINKDDVKFIKISYMTYFGIGDYTITKGDNNEITIVTNEREQFRFFIFLKNREQLKYLKREISKMANDNINVFFYSGNSQVFPKQVK